MRSELRKFYLAVFGTFFFVQEAFIGAIMVAFYTQYLGFSFAQMTGFFSIILMTRTVAELPCGVIADVLGRKKALIAGELLALAAMCSLLYLAHEKTTSVSMLTLGIGVVWGFGGALSSGNLMPLLHDMALEVGFDKKFQRILSYGHSLSSGVIFFAAIASGYIAEQSLVLPVLFDLAFSLLFILVCALYITSGKPSSMQATLPKGLSSVARNFICELQQVDLLMLIPLGLISGIFFGSERAVFNFLQPQLTGYGVATHLWGWVSSGLFLVAAVVGIIAARLKVESISKMYIALFSLLLLVLSLVFLLVIPNVISVVAFLAVSAAIGILIGPLITTVLLERQAKSSSIKTTIFSVYSFIGAGCSAALQTVTGLAATGMNNHQIIIMCATLSAIVLLIFFLHITKYTDKYAN
jgi:MFS family permease